NRIFDAPRDVLSSVCGDEVVEMPRNREESFCCGGGGANYWYDVAKTEAAGTMRVREAVEAGATVVAAECPFCIKMLELGAQQVGGDTEVTVKDISEVVADALLSITGREQE